MTIDAIAAAALALSLAGLSAVGVSAQRPPTIAAAASLNVVLTEITDRFARATGERVEPVFGASGTLTRQIRDGAPFEMFLAADEEFPNQLAAAGLTRGDGVVYAVGVLALFAPRGSPLEVDAHLDGLARLIRAGGVTRFAIANPEVAPYGGAAEAVLKKRGLWEQVRPRLVLGNSVAQAAQFATTGNAVGGLVAYSLVLAQLKDRGTYAAIPAEDHPPLRHRMVLLERAGPIAERFYRFMQGDEARAIMRRHGFTVPE